MAAATGMESWMQQEDFGSTGEAPASPGQLAATMEARFEAEAMPHLDNIFRTATRVLGERARAEDVVQEVYLQAWKSFDRFASGTNCRAWLYKILFHCVNHHRRKWFRFPQLKEDEEFLFNNLAYTPPVPEHLTDEEILRALDRIPADFRAIVLLVDVEEFAYKDAAEILRIPIGTVMSRLSRGRRLLREQLVGVARSHGMAGGSGMEQRA